MRLLLLALAACATEPQPLDAALEGDACTREPSGDCCALLPDEDAVRACAAAAATHGECGVAVCWQADCTLLRFSFCGAVDAGVD